MSLNFSEEAINGEGNDTRSILLLVPEHCVGLAAPCLPVCEDSPVEPINEAPNDFLGCDFVDNSLRIEDWLTCEDSGSKTLSKE